MLIYISDNSVAGINDCPTCRSHEIQVRFYKDGVVVKCSDCRASTGLQKDLADALQAWKERRIR